IDELKGFLTKIGASDTTITHPTTTLEDLFLRIVRENVPADGAYTGSGT
ncbi:MAG: hypothetical protein H7Z14_11310, partial [Anaerolineae bacterium]|nr:hypothetical protein [Phycisphaerae bacterium]